MASIRKDRDRSGKLNGCRTLQFIDSNGNRRSIRLGKIAARDADNIKRFVEIIDSAKRAGHTLPSEAADWIGCISADLHEKLSMVGLLPKRKDREDSRLGPFIQRYIDSRKSLKPNTLKLVRYAQRALVAFFGEDVPVEDITPGMIREYAEHLHGKHNENTKRTLLAQSRTIFYAAIDHRLIPANPFGKMKNIRPMENHEKMVFVPHEDIQQIINGTNDVRLRLVIALGRYGGLRIPSELERLRWKDIDFERERILIHSSKTERHAGKAFRNIPLFPEIRPHLDAVWAIAREGAELVIEKSYASERTLARRVEAAAKRVGVPMWIRPFHNLRSTRETELVEHFPIHVVAAWIGHTPQIAIKHYLQVTDEHYQRAMCTQMWTQQVAEVDGMRRQHVPR